MIDKATLAGFVERIERLDGEQQTVGLDKRSVFDEAKKAGVNTKMLRRLLAERKRDAKDSATDKEALDEYRGLLGEPGATYRSVAAKLGMTKSKLHRLVPKSRNGTPHDPETGEITETGEREGASQANRLDTPLSPPLPNPEREARSGTNSTGEDHGRDATEIRGASVDAAPHARRERGDEGRGEAGELRSGRSCRDGQEEQAEATQTVGAVASESERVASSSDSDDLTPPLFLDRRSRMSA